MTNLPPPMSTDMIALLHQTQAVSIWNRQTGPVFWYAAGVPGPFYVNTERVIGGDLSEQLLHAITAILASTTDSDQRATQLSRLILDAHQNNPQYQGVIKALAATAIVEFPAGCFDVISGGERRDWLFSIPLAHTLDVPHVFLFKNKTSYCTTLLAAGAKALHVADLINNAASYFDLWFPILETAHLAFVGTLCVNTRGTNGRQRLQDQGHKVVALNNIDIDFFEKSCTDGLITPSTRDEMAVYFQSSALWAETYLLNNPGVFNAAQIDAKSFERLQSFVANDPWKLRADHPAFFDAMHRAIQKRLGNS